MPRRWTKGLVLVAVLATLAAPALARDFTGYEEDERTLQCPAPGQSVPQNQEPPGPGECGANVATYQGHVWDNDVRCNAGGTEAGPTGVKIYQAGSPTNADGGVGICNAGGTVPVQGRVVAAGNSEGGYVYADGDKDNANEQAQGYARVDGKFGPSAPTVRCGDSTGRKDASSPQAKDGQDDCG